MSKNRDQELDKQATRAAIQTGFGNVAGAKNWLGHEIGSGAAIIDDLLLNRNGAQYEDISAVRNS